MSIYIQKATTHFGNIASAGGTGTLAYGSNNTAGNTLIVYPWETSFGTLHDTDITSITDSKGNSYSKVYEVDNTGNTIQWCYVAFGCAGGANTVTLTVAVGGNSWDLAILEYPASAGVRVFNTASRFGGGTALPTVSLTGSVSGDTCISMLTDGNAIGLSTLGAFGAHAATAVYVPDPGGDAWSIQEGTSDGSSPMTVTQGAVDDNWTIGVIALKPATAGAASIGYLPDEPRLRRPLARAPDEPAALKNFAIVQRSVGLFGEAPRILVAIHRPPDENRSFSAVAIPQRSVGFFGEDPRVIPAKHPRLEDVGPVDATTTTFVSTSDVASWYADQPPILGARHPKAEDVGPLDATKPNLGSSWGAFSDDPVARVTGQRPASLPEPGPFSATKPNLGTSWGVFEDPARILPAKHPLLEDIQPIDAATGVLDDVAGWWPDQPPILPAKHPRMEDAIPVDATKPNLGSSWGVFDDTPVARVTIQRPAILPEPGAFSATKPNLGSSWGAFDDTPAARVTLQRPAVLPEPGPFDPTLPNLGSSWGVFPDDPTPRVTKQRPAVLAEPGPFDPTKPNLGSSWGVFADDVPVRTFVKPNVTESWAIDATVPPTTRTFGWQADDVYYRPAIHAPVPADPTMDAVVVVHLGSSGWVQDQPRAPWRVSSLPVDALALPATVKPLASILAIDEPSQRARVARPLPEESLFSRPVVLSWLSVDEPVQGHRRAAVPEEPFPGRSFALSSLGWIYDPTRFRATFAPSLPEAPLLRAAIVTLPSSGWVSDEARPTLRIVHRVDGHPLPNAVTVFHSNSLGWVDDVIRRRPWLRPIVLEDMPLSGVRVVFVGTGYTVSTISQQMRVESASVQIGVTTTSVQLYTRD